VNFGEAVKMSSATNILHSDGGVKDPSVEKLIQVCLYVCMVYLEYNVFMLSCTSVFIVCGKLLDIDGQYKDIILCVLRGVY
jgi:hypothetical protein